MSTETDVCARCPAAGSIRQALNRAVRLVVSEFSFLEGVRRQSRFRGSNCSALRAEWDSRKAALLVGLQEEHLRVLKQTLKSCDRFFDVPCDPCDKKASRSARREWQLSVAADPNFSPATPASWSNDPLGELALRVRRLVGPDWCSGIRRDEATNIPDVSGCLETPRVEGGTLACDPENYSSSPYDLRVGTVKTKGKVRVVTMQSARVKRTLRPLHEHLYDFMSRRKWLVRGEVDRNHVRSLLGSYGSTEGIVSGDYQAATNNIYVEAVETIVNVLAESPSLLPEERTTLIESFRPENLNWVSRKGFKHRIRRGSMMGNLMSFNVLCLLNKACFDIMCSLRRKRGDVKGYRRPLINGDDIAFVGDRAAFDDWVMVTSHYGFIVNESKTGFDPGWLELNSRSFRLTALKDGTWKVRALRKPVLSALLPGNDTSCLLTRLWDGLRTLSPGSFRTMVVMLRHEITLRGVSLSSIPARLRRVLLKDRWFRSAIFTEPCLYKVGIDRSMRHIYRDVRPSDECMQLYEEAGRGSMLGHLEKWLGKTVHPPERVLLCRKHPVLYQRPVPGRIRYQVRWLWLWDAVVWSVWDRLCLPVRHLSSGLWEDDHPHLTVSVTPVVSHQGYPPPPSLMVGVVRSGFVQWPNGLV